MAESIVEVKIRALLEGFEKLEDLARRFEELSRALVSIDGVSSDAASSVAEVGKAGSEATSAVSDLASQAQEVASGLGDISGVSGEASSGLGDVASAAEEAGSSSTKIGALRQQVAALSKELSELLGVGSSAKGSIKDIGVQASATGAAIKKAFSGVGSASPEFDKTQVSVKALAASLGGLSTNAGAAGGALGAVSPKVAGLSAVAAAAGKVLKPLLAILLALAGIKISFDYLKDAANYAGRVETLGIVLKIVGENAGYTVDQLKEYEDQLKDLGISTEAARNGMSQMIQSGISLEKQAGETTSQVARLARASQDLAVATGENSSQTFQRLITNIQQMDSVGLRYMGLTVDMQAAQEKFAQSIGTTADALTQNQKKQAALNAVLEEAAILSGSYEASLDSVSKVMGSMTRHVEEYKNALGQPLLKAYMAVANASTDLLKSLRAIQEEFNESSGFGEELASGVSAVMEPLGDLIAQIYGAILAGIDATGPALAGLGKIIGGLVQPVSELVRFIGNLGVPDVVLGTWEKLAFLINLAGDILQIGAASISESFAYIYDGAEVSARALQELAEAAGNSDLAEYFKASADAAGEASTASREAVQDALEVVATSDSVLAAFAESRLEEKDLIDGTIEAYNKYKAQVIELVGLDRETKLTKREVADAVDKLVDSLEKAKDAGDITEKQFGRLNARLQRLKALAFEDVNKALEQLGTTLRSVQTNISVDAQKIIGNLESLASAATMAGEDFVKLVADKISMAKSIEEVEAFSSVLELASSKWPEMAEPLAQVQRALIGNFEELFQAQLDAISTEAEWDTLRASVVRMGAEGKISVDQVNEALRKGAEKVKSLSGAYGEIKKSLSDLQIASASAAEEISVVDAALEIAAKRAQDSYREMTDGFKELGAAIDQGTELQLTALERRYAREIQLIRNSGKSQQQIEEESVDAYQRMQEKKLEILGEAHQQELQQIRANEIAATAALDSRVSRYKEEAEAIKRALGEESTEYQNALEDQIQQERVADSKIRQIRLDSKQNKLNVLRDQIADYRTYIDTLIAEEQRLLGEIKSIEDEKARIKMTLEERLRDIEKRGMTDGARYRAEQLDLAKNIARAEEEALKGNKELSDRYYSAALRNARELGQEVEGSVSAFTARNNEAQAYQAIAASQTRAAEAAEGALREQLAQTQTSLSDATDKVRGLISNWNELRNSLLQEVRVKIAIAAQDLEKNLGLIKSLTSRKDEFIEIKVKVDQEFKELTEAMRALEKGKEVKVDTSDAIAALKEMRDEAEKLKQYELVVHLEESIRQLERVQEQISGISNTPPMNGKVTLEQSSLDTASKKLGQIKDKVEADLSGQVSLDSESAVQAGDHVARVGAGLESLKDYDQLVIDTIVRTFGNLPETAGFLESIQEDARQLRNDPPVRVNVDAPNLPGMLKDGQKLVEVFRGLKRESVVVDVDSSRLSQTAKEGEQVVDIIRGLNSEPVTVATRGRGFSDLKEQGEGVLRVIDEFGTKTIRPSVDASSIRQLREDAEGAFYVMDEMGIQEFGVRATVNDLPEVEKQGRQTVETLRGLESNTVNISEGKNDLPDMRKDIEETVDKADELDKKDIKLPIDAETREADTKIAALEKELQDLQDKFRDLSSSEVKYKVVVESNADEIKEELEEALTPVDVVSTHTIESNVEEVAETINKDLLNKETKSIHTVKANVDQAKREISSLQRNTSSTHVVTCRKVGCNSDGGLIAKLAGGGFPFNAPSITGYVSGPGTSTSDSIPTMLSDGEFVLQASAVRKWGVDFLRLLNAGIATELPIRKMAEGGLATAASAPSVFGEGLPEVAINFTVGDSSPQRVYSSRDTAKNLANVLRSLQRG